MKMTKKVLALALSLIMIVSMFSIVPMSVSADATRADSWNGYITTTLNISGSDPIDEDNYFTLSETDLYVGDSIKTNGNWLDYALNYTNDEGETVSSKVAGMSAWYCGDTRMFQSQLQYAKINGATDNSPVELTKAGTWRLYANLEDGKQLTLVTFEVKELPRVIYANGTMVFTGSKEIKLYPQDGVPFSEDDIYVGDTIKNNTGGDWWNNKDKYPIHFTKDDGTEITGVITHLHLYGPNADLYYSTWDGDENVLTFANAGTYRINAQFEKVTDAEGNSLDNFTADIRTFEVKALPRMYVNMDGDTIFDANNSVYVYASTGIPFSTDDLYVGDTLKNGSGWWKDFTNVEFTHEDVAYKAKITYLTIADPSGNTTYCEVYKGGAINYALTKTGTYTIYGQAEGVVNVETDESVANLYNVPLRTFEVKAAPRQYVDTEGNAVYGGSKAIKFYPKDGIPFNEDEIFVGDTIQNSTGGDWWNNKDKYPITFTKDDGTVVTGVITHLHLYGPSADLYFSLWQGNSNVLKFTKPGTYRVFATFEKVTDAEGNSLGNFEADVRTFEVKECPHNYEAQETVAPTCDAKGYDSTVCTACGDEIKTNYVDATGHDLSCTDGVVTCSACDYTRTYDAENTTVEVKVNDATGNSKYLKVEAAAFVGETLVNTNGAWWKDYDFTNGDYTGKVYNVWVVKGDLAYFEEYKANRASNESYTDENVFYAQVGFGSTINYTFDEAGTYTIVGAIQYAETSTFLTDVHPFVMATIEVFDAPVAHEHDYTADTTDPTCTEAGKTVYTCDCGDSYEEVIDATGHNYVDGTCKNCGEADPDAPQDGYLESMTIPGFNVKFESDYSVYVYVPKTITNQYATVKVIASKAMYEGDTFVGYSDVELTEGISQGDYMLYEYAGFAAKEIASEIKAHIVAIDADGNEFYGPEKNYSLQSYALNQIKKSTTAAKFKTMMVDFVNYGAAAQVYFSYNTTALANVGAEDYQNLATPTRAYEKHTANTADTSYATQIKGFNLQFLNKVHIYGYVAINGQDIEDIKANWYGEATYVDADGKSQTQRIDLSDMFASGSYYLFSFNNLFSKEMSVPVTFTLYNAEGEQMSNAATYSIESYANSKGSGTDKLAKLTQALMCFGDAASAYFA